MCYLLYVHSRILEQGLCLQYDHLANPVGCLLSTGLHDDVRKVFGGDAQLVGIETEFTLMRMVGADQFDKPLKEHISRLEPVLGKASCIMAVNASSQSFSGC